jgi:hypothetical protein
MSNFIGDLVSSFTGSGAKKAINQGYKTSQGNLASGYGMATTGYNEAQSTLSPYATGGQAGQQAYLSTLGLNGADARTAVQDLYYSDPNQRRISDMTQHGLAQRYNASGRANSGAFTQAATNAFLGDYGNWQNRLAGVGQQGMQAAGQMAGNSMQYGNLGYQYGHDQAGNAINRGSAMAQANNIFAQNVLGAAGVIIGGFTPGKSGQSAFGSMFGGGAPASQSGPQGMPAMSSAASGALGGGGYGSAAPAAGGFQFPSTGQTQLYGGGYGYQTSAFNPYTPYSFR